MPTSARFAIDYPLGTEAPDVDGDILKVVNALEALGAQYGQGTLAARPVSTPGSPGKIGRIYVVTSGAETGQLHYDYGTGWLWLNNIPTVGADSITSVEIAANAVGNSEMADNAVGAAEIQDGVVDADHLVNALKPSQGAGGGTEALRAIGSGAGNVVAGNDGRLTDQRTPTDNSVTQAKMADLAVGTPEIVAAAVTPAKAKIDSAETWNFLGTLQNKSMRVHRHPYGNDRHIESGIVLVSNQGNNDTWYAAGVTYTDAFAVAAMVATSVGSWDGGRSGHHTRSTAGVTVGYFNQVNAFVTQGVCWIAEGQD